MVHQLWNNGCVLEVVPIICASQKFIEARSKVDERYFETLFLKEIYSKDEIIKTAYDIRKIKRITLILVFSAAISKHKCKRLAAEWQGPFKFICNSVT